MNIAATLDRFAGALLAAVTLAVIAEEWGLWRGAAPVAAVLAVCALAALLPGVAWNRRGFVLFGAGLTACLPFAVADWGGVIWRGLGTAAFIAAFFSALTILKTVAQDSPAITRAGAYLAAQKPGRRYLALTSGGAAFTLLLNYGALQLLGALAMSAARADPDPETRAIRARRMLLAVERGLIATLPWSPLSFAVAISTTVIAGTSWGGIVLPSLVSGLIMATTGWALDTAFKPRRTGQGTVAPLSPEAAAAGWRSLAPLAILLAVLVVSVTGLYALTEVRIVGIVSVVVPVMALGWMVLQRRADARVAHPAARLRAYFTGDLLSFRGEMVLLMMAGYIGVTGAQVLAPLLAAAGLDLSDVPGWLILVGFVWVIPLLGQIGMNPIMAVSLMAPSIPSATALGVTPEAVVVALTAGWALSGATSPFTATTLLLGHFAGVSARAVGLRWNGAFAAISGVFLSVWVVVYAYGL